MKKDMGAKILLFPTPVLIVATYDSAGKPNAMAADEAAAQSATEKKRKPLSETVIYESFEVAQ